MREHKEDVTINITESQTIIELSSTLQKYQSEIFLINRSRDGVQEVNAKSLLGLVTLRLKNGHTITVRTVGEDAESAAQGVVEFLTAGS